jgi:hypothetical protein
MKRYKFELVVHEQCDEMWEEFENEGKTGCDEIQKWVKETLAYTGMEFDLKLIAFEDNG